MTTDKMILIVDKPKNCEECRLSITKLGKLYCLPKDTAVSKGEKDCSCPLVAVPRKINPDRIRGAYEATFIEGWNDCLKNILK